MTIKNIFKGAVVLSMLATSSAVFAQEQMPNQQQMPQKSPEERAEHQAQWMRKNLHLTGEQDKKVYDIMLYYAQQADNAKGMRPGYEKKAEKQEIKRDKDTDLRAVLTGDQYDRYQQHVGEMKQRSKDRKMQNGY